MLGLLVSCDRVLVEICLEIFDAVDDSTAETHVPWAPATATPVGEGARGDAQHVCSVVAAEAAVGDAPWVVVVEKTLDGVHLPLLPRDKTTVVESKMLW